jgi:hypothetical protein
LKQALFKGENMVLLNIEMPSCCYECPAYDDRWDYPTCYITNESRGYNFKIHEKRMPGCPLKEDLTCYNCKNLGKYENEIELGYNSPCTSCKRRVQDNFEEEKE